MTEEMEPYPHTKQPASRNSYWDLVKGVLIIFVVLGHSIQYCYEGNYWGHPLFKAIYMFHMPLFVLISGYFARMSVQRYGLHYLVRIARHLVVPAIASGLVYIVVYSFRDSPEPISRFWLLFSIWFLYLIIECSVFLFIMLRGKTLLWRATWLVIPILLAICVPGFICKNQFTYLYPFFLMGAWFNGHESLLRKKSTFIVSLIVYAAIFCIYDDTWYVYRTPWSALDAPAVVYQIYAVRFIGALAGSLLFLTVAKRLERFINWPLLLKIGRATMAIYILQSFVWEFVKAQDHTMNTIESLFVGIAALIVCYSFYLVARRSHLLARLFFGGC